MIELIDASVIVPTLDGQQRILHPTSLRLHERRIAFIGPNGSGKSTLARLCNGLITPSSGRVLVSRPKWLEPETAKTPTEALDTHRDGSAIRRLVSFVFTNPAAQIVMPTAIEDVTLSLRRIHRVKRERIEAARACLARFGIADLADRSVHALSGGQQQLLALASVLATDPGILIADEPTTLLDLRNSRHITEILCALPQQLIVATHDLELAARCERVLVIEDGRVSRDSSLEGADPHTVIDWYRDQQ